jgi:hypothetical protein
MSRFSMIQVVASDSVSMYGLVCGIGGLNLEDGLARVGRILVVMLVGRERSKDSGEDGDSGRLVGLLLEDADCCRAKLVLYRASALEIEGGLVLGSGSLEGGYGWSGGGRFCGDAGVRRVCRVD